MRSPTKPFMERFVRGIWIARPTNGFVAIAFTLVSTFYLISAHSASGQMSASLSKQHLEAIKSACSDMHTRRSSRVRCVVQMRKRYAGKLLDLGSYLRQNLLDQEGLDRIMTECEGTRIYGPPEKRVERYDRCLRKFVNLAAPPAPEPAPYLRQKPHLLIVSGSCSPFQKSTSVTADEFRSHVIAGLRNRVSRISNIGNFVSQFWCSNRKLFFRETRKSYQGRGHLYTLHIDFSATDNFKDRLEFELYDLKGETPISKGNLFRGNLEHLSSQNPRERAARAANILIKSMSDYQKR